MRLNPATCLLGTRDATSHYRRLEGAALGAAAAAATVTLVTACLLKGTSPGGAEERNRYLRRPSLRGDSILPRRMDEPSLEDINRNFEKRADGKP